MNLIEMGSQPSALLPKIDTRNMIRLRKHSVIAERKIKLLAGEIRQSSQTRRARFDCEHEVDEIELDLMWH